MSTRAFIDGRCACGRRAGALVDLNEGTPPTLKCSTCQAKERTEGKLAARRGTCTHCHVVRTSGGENTGKCRFCGEWMIYAGGAWRPKFKRGSKPRQLVERKPIPHHPLDAPR